MSVLSVSFPAQSCQLLKQTHFSLLHSLAAAGLSNGMMCGEGDTVCQDYKCQCSNSNLIFNIVSYKTNIFVLCFFITLSSYFYFWVLIFSNKVKMYPFKINSIILTT